MNEHAPFISLLTDYGTADEFVGVCRAVIAKLCPQAVVVDLTHGVPRQDVLAGAVILTQALPYMPVGVHVAIVDPGVGGGRRAVALRLAGGRVLVGPDNGLLWPAAQAGGGVQAGVEISNSRWRLEPLSATFHGRDIFSPVAARLAAGEPLEAAGEPLDPTALIKLDLPRARLDAGTLVVPVLRFDHFGNVQLGARLEQLHLQPGKQVRVTFPSGESTDATLVSTFTDVADGEALLFADSSAQLALALSHGSAARRFSLSAGDQLRIDAPGA